MDGRLIADRLQNVASEVRPDKKLHSKSGTLAYLAPEVYSGAGYMHEVDWWSLGVVFYECIYNKVRGPASGLVAAAGSRWAAETICHPRT